jgi:hypothetical protein
MPQHPLDPIDSDRPAGGAPQLQEAVRSALSRDWPPISVVWIDAEARGGPGWEDAEDLVEFALKPLAEVHTVGLLIHACEQFVALTDSRGPDQVGVVQKIPRAWVVSMDLLVPSDEGAPPTLSIDDARVG